MAKNRYWYALSILLMSLGNLGLNSLPAKAGNQGTGTKGAEIYCYMRKTGNNHEVSWDAAYALIKRQTNSMFKTSPKHAAVMIVEAVVEEPNNFPECGRFLGELFGGKTLEEQASKSSANLNSENRYNY